MKQVINVVDLNVRKGLPHKPKQIFTAQEKELIVIGLNMRKNLIETGDTALSAEMAHLMGLDHLIKYLSMEQKQLVRDTEELLGKLYL